VKPLVYVAGPYTAPDPILNVQRAVHVADQLDERGCAVIVPHLSMLWHLVSPADIDTWYRRDLEVLNHCNALVRFDGASTGADREVDHAHKTGLHVFLLRSDGTFPRQFDAWLAHQHARTA
jgi:hypothetical protein